MKLALPVAMMMLMLAAFAAPAQAGITCSGTLPDMASHTAVIDNLTVEIDALSPRIARARVESELTDMQRELDELNRAVKAQTIQAMNELNDYLATCGDDLSP